MTIHRMCTTTLSSLTVSQSRQQFLFLAQTSMHTQNGMKLAPGSAGLSGHIRICHGQVHNSTLPDVHGHHLRLKVIVLLQRYRLQPLSQVHQVRRVYVSHDGQKKTVSYMSVIARGGGNYTSPISIRASKAAIMTEKVAAHAL